MVTVWVLTIGFTLGNAPMSTEKYGPYDTYELCKQAGEKFTPIAPASVATATPIGCTPEYHGSDKVVNPNQGLIDFQRQIIDLLRWSTENLQGK